VAEKDLMVWEIREVGEIWEIGEAEIFYKFGSAMRDMIFEKKESDMGKMYNYILVVSVVAITAIIIASFIVPSEAELIAKGISPTVRYSRLAWVVAGAALCFLPIGLFSDD
jgi:hypothetical protein